MQQISIQKAIFQALGYRSLPYRDLRKKLSDEYGIDVVTTSHEVMQMKNNGYLDSIEKNIIWDDSERLYFTPAGQKYFWPRYKKVLRYICSEWISIVALLISILALLKK